jgi:co-chaperonin GroES (HSP10)
MKTCRLYIFVLMIGTSAIVSCQKEIDGLTAGGIVIPTPADQNPKVGTT